MVIISLTSFLILLVLVQTASSSNNLKSKVKNTYTQEVQDHWKALFNATRGQSCQAAQLRKKILAAAQAEASARVKGTKAKKGVFAWIKDWGFGGSAYIFDFLDPVIRSDILEEFRKIYDEMMKLPSEDTAEYKDPFDLTKLLSSDDKTLSAKAKGDLSLLNKNYDKAIYDVSVNAVQLRSAMISWKWSMDFGLSDFAKSFIKQYDMNGDGRLNARELILGAIDHNKHLFGSGVQCTNCFQNITQKLDAMFTYIDCNDDGVISAEDLWNNLSQLKRPSPQCNVFALGKDAAIRTAAVNDFVLKSMGANNGVINKVDFRNSVLFGVWNRQTTYKAIVSDESRNLKDLRWKDDHMVDIKAEEYITEKMVNDLKLAKK